MAGSKILVLGGTGPAGICLLRELLHRQHATIAYARNPAKIPADLASNPLLEVVKGELTDTEALSKAVSQSNVIISLLGPAGIFTRTYTPTTFSDFYVRLFEIMKKHGVRRIFAMGTASIPREGDQFSLARLLMIAVIWTVINHAYRAIRAIERAFDQERSGEIDWTVYRIAGIPGGADDAAWRADREDGDAYEGAIGAKGWTIWQRRGALARWLVDAAEDGRKQWIGEMPAVSRLAGSKKKTA